MSHSNGETKEQRLQGIDAKIKYYNMLFQGTPKQYKLQYMQAYNKMKEESRRLKEEIEEERRNYPNSV